MSKLSSQIDVLKASRSQRHSSYYGLRKSRVGQGAPPPDGSTAPYRPVGRKRLSTGTLQKRSPAAVLNKREKTMKT